MKATIMLPVHLKDKSSLYIEMVLGVKIVDRIGSLIFIKEGLLITDK